MLAETQAASTLGTMTAGVVIAVEVMESYKTSQLPMGRLRRGNWLYFVASWVIICSMGKGNKLFQSNWELFGPKIAWFCVADLHELLLFVKLQLPIVYIRCCQDPGEFRGFLYHVLPRQTKQLCALFVL